MATAFNPQVIERPDPLLLRYYFYYSLLGLFAFPLVYLRYWCRFITLRYKFDEDGVSMSYGVLFKREVNLTYRRIQDIHVTRNLLQRWMGLATISLQTASGSSQAEMAIEGVLEPELLRDYLYARMRGARDETLARPATARQSESSEPVLASVIDGGMPTPAGHQGTAGNDSRTLQTLVEIRDALRVLVEREGAGK
ncbi:MAG: PH domain-containing protein [Aureliella sp.]|jgi:putative membrane protein